MLMAQTQKQFSLDDLMWGGRTAHKFAVENRSLTWWGERLVRQDVEACYEVNLKTGRETPLLALDDLRKAGIADVHTLQYATFPYAGEKLALIATGSGRVLYDFDRQRRVWADQGRGRQASAFCPDTRATAYVQGDQLYVRTADGSDRRLTTDGSREIVYGQSVHRDEFGITHGLFWSPRGERLAFYRMDQSMVADYPQVYYPPTPQSQADTAQMARHAPDKYPMAGCTSHKVTVGVYDVKSGSTHYLQTGDPTDRYFTNVAWSPDAATLYLFELNRDQNDCRLVAYDAATGSRLGELYRETSDKYVEPQHPIEFLPWDGNHFVMQSQRDGYNHLYLYAKDGRLVRQLTQGPWVVMELVGFDRDHKSIVFAANKENPLQRNLYSVRVSDGRISALDNGRGWHTARLSAAGSALVDSWSEPDVPRRIALRRTGQARSLDYFSAPNPWQGYNVPRFESGTLKAADGTTDLYYRLVKPANFDASKKYPVVIYVYGGPHAHNVDARWHYAARPWETYMAQRGYVLFVLDNRGSENRGLAFEQATFRHLGREEMADQMRGVEFLKSQSYIDTVRIGVHGWSFGGFMTTNLMLTHPDVFKVGVAGGPVIDWHLYEVMYGERYMDTPAQNPEGYAESNLCLKAGRLKGRLQIINGLNDPTCVPQHTFSFLRAAADAGTQPDYFTYPGDGHNMQGRDQVHLHERITRYFDDYLMPLGQK